MIEKDKPSSSPAFVWDSGNSLMVSKGSSCYLLSKGSSFGESLRGPKGLAGDGGFGPLCCEQTKQTNKTLLTANPCYQITNDLLDRLVTYQSLKASKFYKPSLGCQ